MWGKPNDNLPLAGGLAGGKDCFKGWFGVTSKGLKGAGLLTTGADFDLKNFEGGFLGAWTTGTGAGCLMMGSKSLSLPSKPDEPVFLDLKNFLGLATSEPEDNIEADLIDVKDADPHFPTTPADFEAETPRKENETKLVKTWQQIVLILYSKPVKPHFSTTPADFEDETPKKNVTMKLKKTR